MARPRMPTETLELKGAFRKDPQRKRDVGPKSTIAFGDAPSHLSAAEAICWNEVTADIAHGVLTSAERYTVEIVARLMARFRSDWLTGSELGQLTKALASLGMTPVDRSKVQAAKVAPISDFDEFLTAH